MVIIGAGPAGLPVAAALWHLGVHDVVLLDRFGAPATPFHERIDRLERELIAAYVSGVNSCGYCHGVHTAAAEACGIAEGVVPAAVAGLDDAPVPENMRPVLRYVGKLTRTPASVTRADAEEVLAAGWDEDALHSAVMVCALFNLMNRMVEGHGITAGSEYFAMSGHRLKEVGYAGLNRLLEA